MACGTNRPRWDFGRGSQTLTIVSNFSRRTRYPPTVRGDRIVRLNRHRVRSGVWCRSYALGESRRDRVSPAYFYNPAATSRGGVLLQKKRIGLPRRWSSRANIRQVLSHQKAKRNEEFAPGSRGHGTMTMSWTERVSEATSRTRSKDNKATEIAQGRFLRHKEQPRTTRPHFSLQPLASVRRVTPAVQDGPDRDSL